ncbi:MAG: leucine-rich repeat domain-containing protein [Ruminococcus sp.]|uniref:leucine-rich repeat domain-containing protein n=1 Tax=Ruminococcus sp. TaxID=41978 RepID=UPI0025D6B435|nr:leucine-rich repeat domain-containing protein [Ruminococcus sp.]MCR4794602.1 leucine-rich repeat domain-containing protein [Ruminococcus sp.]
MKNIILAAAAVFFMFIACGKEAYAEESSGYEYTVIDREVTIVGYKGGPEFIEIPEYIEGCPVTEVRDNAFYNCHSLKEAVLPDTVLKIGHHSFYACYELESIRLPAELEEIGMGCFCGCAALKEIKLPETLEILPDSCFRACTSLSEIRLPRNTRVIEKFCFAGCTGLCSAELGDSIAAVGERAFYMCEKLSCAVLPRTCYDIGEQAFGYSCDGNKMTVKTDMMLVGVNESAAERYAAENGLRFAESHETIDAFAEAVDIEKGRKAPEQVGWYGLAVFGMIGVITVVIFFNGKKEG